MGWVVSQQGELVGEESELNFLHSSLLASCLLPENIHAEREREREGSSFLPKLSNPEQDRGFEGRRIGETGMREVRMGDTERMAHQNLVGGNGGMQGAHGECNELGLQKQ